jgi:hypothetical protein
VASRVLETSTVPVAVRVLVPSVGSALATSSRIQRPLSEPSPLIYLPANGRVLASEKLAQECPWQAGLAAGLTAVARYRRGGAKPEETREGELFVTTPWDGTPTWLYLSRLPSFHDLLARSKGEAELAVGDQGWSGSLGGQPCMVAERSAVVFGVRGSLKADEMRELLVAVDRRVQPYVPTAFQDLEQQRQKQRDKDSQQRKIEETYQAVPFRQ